MLVSIAAKLGTAISWDEMSVLDAVLRGRSFSAAGESLGINQSRVSRAVKEIEERLGERLFVRRANGVTPTSLMDSITPKIAAMRELVEDTDRMLSGADARLKGDVRIACTEGLGAIWLTPRLLPFQRANPDVKLRFVSSFRAGASDTPATDAIALGDVDIAVRLERPNNPDHVLDQVGVVKFALYCSRDYIHTYGMPNTVDDLRGHKIVDYAVDELAGWTNIRAQCNVVGFETVSSFMHWQAITAGYGIGPLPTYVSNHDAYNLVRLPIEIGDALPIYLVYDKFHPLPARVRSTISHIKAAFAKDRSTWFS